MAIRSAVGTIAVSALVPAVAAVGLLADAARTGEVPARDDRAASAGTWKVARVVLNGKELDHEFTSTLTVSYAADGSWVVWFKTIPVARGTSIVDQRTQPASFDVRTLGVGAANSAGGNYVGIYDMQGDTRQLCFVSADSPRPAAFRSTEKGGEILVTLRRVDARGERPP